MKTVLTIFCIILAIPVVAKENYRQPSILSVTEAKQAQKDLNQHKKNIKKHWQTRLNIARQNKQKLAAPGLPLQRPYFGDFSQKK